MKSNKLYICLSKIITYLYILPSLLPNPTVLGIIVIQFIGRKLTIFTQKKTQKTTL